MNKTKKQLPALQTAEHAEGWEGEKEGEEATTQRDVPVHKSKVLKQIDNLKWTMSSIHSKLFTCFFKVFQNTQLLFGAS